MGPYPQITVPANNCFIHGEHETPTCCLWTNASLMCLKLITSEQKEAADCTLLDWSMYESWLNGNAEWLQTEIQSSVGHNPCPELDNEGKLLFTL